MTIRKYRPEHDFLGTLALMESEGEEWSCYWGEKYRAAYQKSLEQSITYVAESDGEIIGFSRSIEDFGFYIYICDLLVHVDFRGMGLGERLMTPLYDQFPNHELFVMSDVDAYYVKLGFTREGSIFKLPKGIL
jgi:ribosomal protein S18 acetylase RimI-like enzyme